jgi:hypothetical protein
MPTTTTCQRLPKFSRPQRSAQPTNTKRKDNRRRLCLVLVKNLFIHRGISYLHKYKRTTAQTTITTTPPRHQEGRGQPKVEQATLATLRMGVPGSRGNPLDPPSRPHCNRTRVALAQLLASGSATRRRSMGAPANPISGHDVDPTVE